MNTNPGQHEKEHTESGAQMLTIVLHDPIACSEMIGCPQCCEGARDIPLSPKYASCDTMEWMASCIE